MSSLPIANLSVHGRQIDSVFQLLGERENDMTYSLGWALSHSPVFLKAFLKEVIHFTGPLKHVDITLQQHEKKKGITDIELTQGEDFHVIVEAKRGWSLPSAHQLSTYAHRRAFRQSTAARKAIITLSECSRDYAEHYSERTQIGRIPVTHLSWKALHRIASGSKGTHAEKRLLAELVRYLEAIMTMQNKESNLVYVVSVSTEKHRGWKIDWIDIVEEKHLYFHPVGGAGWPVDPPNYIAFRYHGKLQSIRHIRSYKVTKNLHKDIREIPAGEWEPMFLYTLDKPILPTREVRTGRIFRNGRVWCMLDTLLTCKTISEARDVTKKRLRED